MEIRDIGTAGKIGAEAGVNLRRALIKLLESLRTKRKEAALDPIRIRLTWAMGQHFVEQGDLFLKGLFDLRHTFVEATGSQVDTIWNGVVAETLDVMKESVYNASQESLQLGGTQALADLGMTATFNVYNPRAMDYLAGQSAKMITAINETTRDRIKTIIVEGGEQGLSYNEVAKNIKREFREFAIGKPQKHIRSRAHLVAITESGNAYEQGALEAGRQMQDLGLVIEKKWSTTGDQRVSQGCLENENMGWIPLDQTFESGHDAPLRFPGCRCDLMQRTVDPKKQ